MGPQVPPAAVTASARDGARRRPRGPPMDYRDNPHCRYRRGQGWTPIRGQLPEPIDRQRRELGPELSSAV